MSTTTTTSGERPEVGVHGSFTVGSDVYPCTVVWVSRSGHQIGVQQDRVVRGRECRGVIFARAHDGECHTFTRRANGRYMRVGPASPPPCNAALAKAPR